MAVTQISNLQIQSYTAVSEIEEECRLHLEVA